MLKAVLKIVVMFGLLLSSQAYAQSYTWFGGVTQSDINDPDYGQPLVNATYERQNYKLILATQYAWFDQYQYLPTDGENWLFQIIHAPTNYVLGTVEYKYSGTAESGCFYARVNSGPWSSAGCIDFVSSNQYQYWILTFWMTLPMQCAPTDDYQIIAYNNNRSFPTVGFKPTEFEPDYPFIQGGSLVDIKPTLGTEQPDYMSLSVQIEDNLECGMPIKNQPLEVRNTVVPQTGSHLHFTSDSEQGTGKYAVSAPMWDASSDNDTRLQGHTDENGIFYAQYEAGKFGVREKVYVATENPATGETLDTEGLFNIRIPDLVPLTGDLYELRGSYGTSCDRQHNDSETDRRSNYLTSATSVSVESIANDYNTRFSRMLSFNDASLEFGGFFDGGTRGSTCHVSHRKGIDIDLNSTDANGQDVRANTTVNNVPVPILYIIQQMVEDNDGCQIYESGSPPPIHFRFGSRQGCLP